MDEKNATNNEFETTFSSEYVNSLDWEKSCCNLGCHENSGIDPQEQKQKMDDVPPPSFLDNWLLYETTGQPRKTWY